LSNLLCLWAASIVFMLGLAAVALSFLWMPLGIAAAVLPRVLISFVLGAAHLLAKIPYHAVYFVNPYLKYWLAFAYLLFVAAYVLKPKRSRHYGVAAVLAALSLAVTVVLGAAKYQSALDTVVLDVGQGQSVVLASEDRVALVDCGSANSWYDAGSVAADTLLTMGYQKVDYLVLTHYDSDHTGGVESLLSRIGAETVFLPPSEVENPAYQEIVELAHRYGVQVQTVREETELPLGLAGLKLFPPVAESVDSNNESGLSVLSSAGDSEVLITGDADSATERKLLERYHLPDVEVLVAGHHGSKYSTSNDLLDALQPETVCISVGSNSYGHPADETMRRLAEHGCGIYRTDLQGMIHLTFD
jgi:competence protein ComEC